MPSKEDIDNQLQLLHIHRRNLSKYLRQRALHGEASTPLGILNGIDDERENIIRIKTILRRWGVQVPDKPEDEDNVYAKNSLNRSTTITQNRNTNKVIDKNTTPKNKSFRREKWVIPEREHKIYDYLKNITDYIKIFLQYLSDRYKINIIVFILRF